MKSSILFLFVFLYTLSSLNAQAPLGIPYQGIARDNAGNELVSQSVNLRFSIHDSSASGPIVYQETHTTTTNNLGLINLNIGKGIAVIGNFSNIDWGSDAKFLQVELDPAGGTSYVDMSTTQMMSVPYALYAEKTKTKTSVQKFSSNVPIQSIAGNATEYVFAGGTTNITLIDSTTITGVASTSIALLTDTIQAFQYGLCYQEGIEGIFNFGGIYLPSWTSTGPIINFEGSNLLSGQLDTKRESISVSSSVILPPGTFKIGLGIKNIGPLSIDNNSRVNGWIMLTTP